MGITNFTNTRVSKTNTAKHENVRYTPFSFLFRILTEAWYIIHELTTQWVGNPKVWRIRELSSYPSWSLINHSLLAHDEYQHAKNNEVIHSLHTFAQNKKTGTLHLQYSSNDSVFTRGHSAQCTPPPRHTEVSTVSLPANRSFPKFNHFSLVHNELIA